MKKLCLIAILVCLTATVAMAQEKRTWSYKGSEGKIQGTLDLAGRVDYNRDFFSSGQTVYFNISDGFYNVDNTIDRNGYVSLWMFQRNKLDRFDRLHQGILLNIETQGPEDGWIGEKEVYVATIVYKNPNNEYSVITRYISEAIPQQGVIIFNW